MSICCSIVHKSCENALNSQLATLASKFVREREREKEHHCMAASTTHCSRVGAHARAVQLDYRLSAKLSTQVLRSFEFTGHVQRESFAASQILIY